MTEDPGKWSRDTVPASPGAPARARSTEEESPFDPRRDRFEEKAELGRGGMGRVFEAHDTALDRPVAIKQSLVDDLEIQARFEREVRITARLQHPGIVPVLDAGRDENGRPFYVMRKIEGRPLAELVTEAKTVRDRLALVPRVLAAVDAVAYAHARGVIHRDIKPWNVLLGPFGETLLIDWGLARAVDDADDKPLPASSVEVEGLTHAGRAYGTPGFMAPEQARGEALDRSVDVYALGATLYHVLAGTRPFAEIASTRAIEVAASGELPDLGKVPDEVPPELTAIMTKAMAASRDDRYGDASALAEDLRRFLSGQLVAAHRYTAAQLVARFVRRHRLAVATGAVAAILLAVLATLSIRRVIDERDRADAARAAQAQRGDELLVERADAIVTADPARALALLAQLPPNSAAWDRAQSVAETAQFYGVGRGRMIDIVTTDAKMARVVASANGKHVIVLAGESVMLGEPSLATPLRTIAKLPLSESKALAWVENDTAVVFADAKHTLMKLEIATGKTVPLDAGGVIDRLVPPASDGVVLVLGDGKLRRIDLASGPALSVPCGNGAAVLRVDRIAGATVCATAKELWLHRDDNTSHRLYEGDSAGTFQVGTVVSRVAVAERDRVIEWDLAPNPPVERGTWSIIAVGISYAVTELVAFDNGGVSWLGEDGTTVRDLRSSYYPTVSAIELLLSSGPLGLAFSMPGSLRVFRGGRSHSVGGRTEALISADQAGPYLIGISATGLLRSWHLDEALPQTVVGDETSSPMGLNDHIVWFRTKDKTMVAAQLDDRGELGPELDFGTGDRRCYGVGRDVLVRETSATERIVEVVDHERKTRRNLRGEIIGIACSTDAAVVAVMLPGLIKVLDTRSGEKLAQFAVEKPLYHLAVGGRWTAYVDLDGKLVRVDRESGKRDELQTGAVEQLAIEDDGRVSMIRGATVQLWAGTGLPTTAITARSVKTLIPSPAGLVVVTDANTVWLIESNGRVRSYQTGSRTVPSIARNEPFVLITDLDQNLAILDLRSGSMRRLPWWAEFAGLGTDARVVFGLFGSYALIQRSTVPRDRAGLRAWVAGATNATLAPGSTRLDWPK